MMKRIIACISCAAMLVSGAFCSSAAEQSAFSMIGAPSGIVEEADDSMMVTDTYNKVIWRIEGGVPSLYSGKIGVKDLSGEPVGGYRDSTNTESFYLEPWDIVKYADGYAVSDTANHVIRFVNGTTTRTLTGNRSESYTEGKGISAGFSYPKGMAVGDDGRLYIADSGNNAVRVMDKEGNVSTYASGINAPAGLCFRNGSLYVAESGANRIIKIENGNAVPVAGSGTAGFADGEAMNAAFSRPEGITVSQDGTIYISDTGNKAVRRIRNGRTDTVIKSDPSAMSLYPQEPRGMLYSNGKLYICDVFSKKLITAELHD